MKNIFEYATKELSQDAFLCCFIANCNDEAISEYSYDFINLITGFNFGVGDIKHVQIIQQGNNMDIIVDFWTSDNKDAKSHYVIIIEDKTNSSAGDNQLVKYAEIMDGWNTNEPGYKDRRRKVFYKVNGLSNKDNSEIDKANEKYQ